MKIDKLDRRILAIISDNARIPFRDVAERCGVSRAAIHQHVQRMVERGVITGSGYRVNPKDLGYTTCTYTMLIKLYAVDNSHLMHILSNRIQSIAGVSSTETLISLAEGFVRNMPIPEEDTTDSYTSYNAE